MGLYLSSRSGSENVPDKFTGLSRKQKNAIKSSWKLLEKGREKHAIKIFIRFFRKYPRYRRYFLDTPDVSMSTLATDPYMQRHCLAFMKEIDYLIYVVIQKPQILDDAIENLAKIHKDMHVDSKDVKRLMRTLILYLKNEFPVKFGTYQIETWNIFLEEFIKSFVKKMSIQRLQDEAEEEERLNQAASSLDKTETITPKNLKDAEKEFWENRRRYWKDKHESWHGATEDLTGINEDGNEDSYLPTTRTRSCSCFSLCDRSNRIYTPSPYLAGSNEETRSLTGSDSPAGSGIRKTYKITTDEFSPRLLSANNAISITLTMPTEEDRSETSSPIRRSPDQRKVTFDSKLTLFATHSLHTSISKPSPFHLQSIFCCNARERQSRWSASNGRRIDGHYFP